MTEKVLNTSIRVTTMYMITARESISACTNKLSICISCTYADFPQLAGQDPFIFNLKFMDGNDVMDGNNFILIFLLVFISTRSSFITSLSSINFGLKINGSCPASNLVKQKSLLAEA